MELSKQDVVSHVVAFGLGVLLGYQMEMEKIGTHAVAFAIGIAVGYYYKKWKDENWHRR